MISIDSQGDNDFDWLIVKVIMISIDSQGDNDFDW